MTKRNVNVDLFRVIATMLVIVLHVLGQGGILNNTTHSEENFWIAWFLEICAYGAVNCFALISGYIMVNKKIKTKNIIALWFQLLFYSLLITALFFVFLPETRGIGNLVKAILPVTYKQWWYVSSYFALFFLIPFLNEAINRISQRIYKKILIVILVGICFIDCIVPVDAFLLNDGYSSIWLVIVYLLGAYIRKYDVSKKITALKSLLGFFAMCVITVISKVVIYFLNRRFPKLPFSENLFISYISITIVLASIFLFLFCLNIKTNNITSKVICFLAPATLGVYLIHVHPLVFRYILKNAFVSFTDKIWIVMVIYILLATIAIFVICTAIDLLRIQLFKLIQVKKMCEFISKKINAIYAKVFEK